MAGAIRLVSLQRGHDPRDFAIFAFGGAGPLHGSALAKDLGIPKMIVPYVPGITCALGCIVADVRHDFVRTVSRLLGDLDPNEISDVIDLHRKEGEARLKADQVPVAQVEIQHFADMQYEGQTYTLRVPIPHDDISISRLRDSLAQAFKTRFGIDLSSFRPKLINIRTTVTGVRRPLDLKTIFKAAPKVAAFADAKLGERSVWFDGEWVRTPIYDRSSLPIESRIAGPAIFNQMDTTTVAEPDTVTTVDDVGNLIVEMTA
jgi:N-methylhydantoinase A